MNDNQFNRRDFLKVFAGGAALTAATLAGCNTNKENQVRGGLSASTQKIEGGMEYRTSPTTNDRVSLLGFGCMRFPTITGQSAREGNDPIDQQAVNDMFDYAIEHGVNYFDTSPAYCKGKSETVTGIALSRHPRNTYYIATKLSNFAPDTWSREASMKMYQRSFEYLQVDYIDYMLLHAIGGSAKDLQGNELDAMQTYRARYEDNGMLQFLIDERKKGKIRNLGFSYHGDIAVFDYLLSRHEEIKWDFVQIQMNYVDWEYAKQINDRNTNAEYLYAELDKRGIPAVIMEPLLGGRLASLPQHLNDMLKAQRPDDSTASWAFRYLGSFPRVYTVLSGMTVMEHLQDNLRTYSPLEPLSDNEQHLLYDVAKLMVDYPLVNCTGCQYCMPCPYGLDIPSIFAHYNKCVSEDCIPSDVGDAHYKQLRKQYLVSYDRKIPKVRQANHCIGCNQCALHCPQNIAIPQELQRIDAYVEKLKRQL